jgi:hypothetical protein
VKRVQTFTMIVVKKEENSKDKQRERRKIYGRKKETRDPF